jgi:hypothetical protein
VIVEGVATLVTEEARLARLADAWSTKWDGRWTLVVHDGSLRHDADGELLAFRIEAYAVAPTRAYAHAKGTFAHTRYEFA